jgi:hypothetical protein
MVTSVNANVAFWRTNPVGRARKTLRKSRVPIADRSNAPPRRHGTERDHARTHQFPLGKTPKKLQTFRIETCSSSPSSVDEWLPEKHLARFVVEVIEGLDLRAMSGSYSQ